MFGCPPCLDTPICLDAPICLDTPMFGCPHIFRCPPICLDAPICLDTPICLGTLHISECPTHIRMPPCSMYICMFLGDICIWYGDGGIYTPHIECSDANTRIINKKHYKFVHVGKHKYLDKTPYDLYELYIYLSKAGLGGVWIVYLSDEDRQLILVIGSPPGPTSE